MSTSLFRFGGRAFWIHGGVAEIWFSAFADEVQLNFDDVVWLGEISSKIEEALRHAWVTAVVDIFDEYANLINFSTLKSIVVAVNARLVLLAEADEVVKANSFQAARSFLLPEIEMLSFIFFSPEKVAAPPRVFTLDEGWKVA
ncbi:hypothetical protein [Roseateles sp.]|uniref:hypothetical protein n=1 Tax=Roseateles sp. TaxID=1971397 RepID=UPI0031DADE9F